MTLQTETQNTPALTRFVDLEGDLRRIWTPYFRRPLYPETAVLEALPFVRDLTRPVVDGRADLSGLLPADTNTLPSEQYHDGFDLYHDGGIGWRYASGSGFYTPDATPDEELARVQPHLHLKPGGTLYLVFHRSDRWSPAYLATRIRLTEGGAA